MKNIVSANLTCALVAVMSCLPTQSTQAQNDLTVHVEGLGADTVYLAHYYGAKLFYNDTAVANAEGTVRFEGKPRNEGGKYAVVLPGPKFFEFLMVEEPMEFKTTATNPAKGPRSDPKQGERRVLWLHEVHPRQEERTRPF